MQAQLKEEEDRQEREYREAQSNRYDTVGGVRYRPEDFHFLKVLGKGSFGKVSLLNRVQNRVCNFRKIWKTAG